MAKLTPKQKIFVDEYLIDLNATQAAIRAGYSPKTARQIAEQNLSKLDIQNAISKAQAERAERLRISADDVLKMWHNIATVDYNEISQLLNVNCRHCWGVNHDYQFTPKEWEIACEMAQAVGKPNPNCGGVDFKHKREPNPNCPECGGLGQATIHLQDTNRLSPQAKLVYQGAKAGKFGVEVLTTDRMKALDNIAKHLGMFTEKVELSGRDGQAIEQNLTVKFI